jgi:threonyl-tRNA synthetase
MKKIEKIRHSLAHILAYAVQELYPGTKFGIGPVIEKGFYYDFEFKNPITNEDLPKIEKKMREIIKKGVNFKKKGVDFKEAKEIFKDQPFKKELIEDLQNYGTTEYEEIKLIKEGKKKAKKVKNVTLYLTGNFLDLCRGGHVKNSKEINPEAFKLTKIAGAYWRGNEKNPMLTRIYGVAFETKEELENYLKIQEEAEKRDHRILGQKLELFLFDEEVGQGLPIWTPKGTILRKIIQDFLFEELKSQGYQWVITPHLGNLNLWKTSGHWFMYRENMYSPIKIDEEEYLIKPMNCPFHTKIYKSKIRSYKELPIKFAEFGTVYRYERSGTLHGLTRVRGFTQDDAHIWCTPEQLANEVEKLLKHGLKILKTFGFKEFNVYLATRPEKFAGTEKMWEKAMAVLKYVLRKQEIKYQEDPGGGVFYGPKIDIKIKDVLGREWQCTTLQIDFNLPERFDLTYIDEKGRKKRPIMIHRAFLGSIERFIGVLLENTGGALPLWLSPEQIWVIPVGKRHEKYAKEIGMIMQKLGLRIKIKDENETVSKKIREGEIQKIPYMLVVGDKEMESGAVRVRKRQKGDIGEMKLTEFITKIKNEIEKKK